MLPRRNPRLSMSNSAMPGHVFATRVWCTGTDSNPLLRRIAPMSNECDRSPTYLSYMLRLWQAGSRNGKSVWRASLENPHTGERLAFGGVEALVAFLVEKTDSPMERRRHTRNVSAQGCSRRKDNPMKRRTVFASSHRALPDYSCVPFPEPVLPRRAGLAYRVAGRPTPTRWVSASVIPPPGIRTSSHSKPGR